MDCRDRFAKHRRISEFHTARRSDQVCTFLFLNVRPTVGKNVNVRNPKLSSFSVDTSDVHCTGLMFLYELYLKKAEIPIENVHNTMIRLRTLMKTAEMREYAPSGAFLSKAIR